MLLLVALALAAPPPQPVDDLGDALHRIETGRPADALPWLAAELEARPLDLELHAAWLSAQGLIDGDRRHQTTLYTRWAEAKPTDLRRRFAAAMATAAAANDPRRTEFWHPLARGPWCESVLRQVDVRPPGAVALTFTHALYTACDRPTATLDARLRADRTEPVPTPLQVALRIADGLDTTELTDLRVLADQRPWTLAALEPLWATDARGPALEDGRAIVLAAARAAREPDELAAAARVLRMARLPEEASATEAALLRLDPRGLDPAMPELRISASDPPAMEAEPHSALPDRPAPSRGAQPGDPPVSAEPIAPPSPSDARAVAKPPASQPAPDAAPRDRAAPPASGACAEEPLSCLPWIRAAAAAKRQLGLALRLADEVVRHTETPEVAALLYPASTDRERWLRAHVAALNARAAVHRARGRSAAALADGIAALRLAPDDAVVLVHAGLAAADAGDPLARGLLGRGLALGGAGDAAVDRAARQALGEVLASEHAWVPGGLNAEIDAWRAAPLLRPHLPHPAPAPAPPPTAAARPPAPAAAPPPRPAPTPISAEVLAGLTFTLDEQQVTLADVPGPVVIDLWATWCGPCKSAMPELEAVAAEHAGKVTVIALSVDKTQLEANLYLDRQPYKAFRRAWIGPEGLTRLGVRGIPHTVILGADHRVVMELHGWSPTQKRLEEAVRGLVKGSEAKGTPPTP